ncbi:hypothetical protein SODALDRAFT_346215 [Sodiomyces alkalinus F11]|uniref:Uncharacterized protein n=1 Tax=Sodiomyces alkalinus (strain CBS 110278 / VKM F-3762 / F11) TaxID=1314773 RepID=A0A3N2PNQ2_SODAK|nr:hypothetical protein SODALDRAFT_346215 [Sodiomyces alkalinus F11]ROT36145.1 hypothetical protein SODALDRAFT_346215 [Sodiomyces alkalinus F11]
MALSWRRGSGASSNRGGGPGRGRDTPWRKARGDDTKTPSKGVCHFFQRTGSCRFGTSCRYSHDLETSNERQSTSGNGTHPTQSSRQEFDFQDQYGDVKRLLRPNRGRSLFNSSTQPSRQVSNTDAYKFWTNAVAILDEDNHQIHHLLAKDLVNDNLRGHEYMATSMNMDDGDIDRSVISAMAYLKVITHPALLDPISIDGFVGEIYTFFGGANGDRAISFLTKLCDRLRRYYAFYCAEPSLESKFETKNTTVALLMLEALSQLLHRQLRVCFNGDLNPLVNQLEQLSAESDLDANTAIPARLAWLWQLLKREQARVAADAPNSEGKGNARVPQHMDLRSIRGRHDNDFADISRIQILPTYSEIDSDETEYLPSTDLTRPNVIEDPVQRHLDCAFRLLRHDIFGPVKDALKDLLAQDVSCNRSVPRFNSDKSAQIYAKASIQHVFVEGHGPNPLQASVVFELPYQLRKKSVDEQRRWWQDSSRLEEGELVAFMFPDGNEKRLLFLEVTVKRVEGPKKGAEKGERRSNTIRLVSKNQPPAIGVKLATLSGENVALLMKAHGEKSQGVLVEVNGLIPGTFVPVLENLQKMMREGDMALRRWILPGSPNDPNSGQPSEIPPPAYARRPGFVFNLDPITKGEPLTIDASQPDSHRNIDMGKIEQLTGLDHGQCEGLIAALTREYALIQGPPGTGKSYVGVQLMRVLLHNKVKAKLGPILVICYTNHALDQFLTHLLHFGISKVIRIGGRSKSEELEGKNLRVVANELDKTRVERHILGKAHSELEERLKNVGQKLKPLHKCRNRPTWEGLGKFLSNYYPRIHAQLQRLDEDGFELVGDDPLAVWLGRKSKGFMFKTNDTTSAVDVEELTRRAENRIHSLSESERWILAESWAASMRQEESERLFELLDQAMGHRQTIHNVHDDLNRRALLQADVIGITTTGLSRNIAMLRRIHAKVVVCEEAAEVLEPHIISALMPGVEHFIQIGDHLQLRPQIQNYSLSLESHQGLAWQLDRSQFERRALGEPGMLPAPVAQLDVQRRMRPEISQLIRGIYPKLKDHDSVAKLPSVVGMRHDLFWLDHKHPETSRDDEARVKSHSNEWEVGMATALVKHLVRQGAYSSSDIALLTPYTGQLRKLRAALSKDFEITLSDRDLETLAREGEGISGDQEEPKEEEGTGMQKALQKKSLIQTLRLATVDNFQGEEAKIIIVSLVRSNQTRKVGFLRTENRITVLLSRAQHGMYLIGNAETYLNVPMWEGVHGRLSQSGAVGTSISLCCPRHEDTPILCSTPEDFMQKSPEGGCTLPCDRRLEPCGHKCQAPCHSQSLHDAFSCAQPCPRIRTTCGHVCPKLCGEKCGQCQVWVKDVVLPCGHIKQKVRCFETLNLSKIRCTVRVKQVVPRCEHHVEVPCYRDVKADTFSCPTPCLEFLACGHQCPGVCSTCRKEGENGAVGFEHGKCKKTCDRPFGTCNHRCSRVCHDGEECGSCEQKCEVRCPHSRCSSTCSKPCSPCIEKCTWSCKHKKACTMPCAAPCDRLPCNKRCDKTLSCGYPCPSYCGEECPTDTRYCRVRGDQGDACVDLLEMKRYSEVDLNENPVIFLGCGHFYTGETIDGHASMAEIRPIRQFSTRRYNRAINKAVMDETAKRFLTNGLRGIQELEKRLEEVQDDLERDPSKTSWIMEFFQATRKRYEAGLKLFHDAGLYRKAMDLEHQPTMKLFDAILTRQREVTGPASLVKQIDGLNISLESPQTRKTLLVSVLDRQVTLRAALVQVHAHEVIARDQLAVAGQKKPEPESAEAKAKPTGLTKSPETLAELCTDIITKAKEAKLPRVAIGAMLAFARLSNLHAELREKRDAALEYLEDALRLCDGLADSEELRKAVESTKQRLLSGPRYEVVTEEERKSIKAAMVGGPRGLSTNSGHWYTCANGHPFAIGECGMPMQLARCPECGAVIGGQDHELVDGVSRAREME